MYQSIELPDNTLIDLPVTILKLYCLSVFLYTYGKTFFNLIFLKYE